MSKKSVMLEENTHAELKQLGGYDDTMNDIVQRLIAHYKAGDEDA